MKKQIFLVLATLFLIGCQSADEKLNKLGYSYSNDDFIDLFTKYLNEPKTSNSEKEFKALEIFIENGIMKDSVVKIKFDEMRMANTFAAILSSKIKLLELLYKENYWDKKLIDNRNLFVLTTDFYCEELEMKNINITLDVFKYLIKKGVNVNKLDSVGQSPLFKCTRTGKSDLAKILLKNGANPNIGWKENKKPHISNVLTAISLNKPEILKMLIDKGVKLDEIDEKDGFNLLMYAILFNSEKSNVITLVKTLVEANKSLINYKNKHSKTPLQYAIISNRYDIAEYLLKNDADPNFIYEADGGKFPYFFTVLINKDFKGANLLLKYGAKVNNTIHINGKTLSLLEAAKETKIQKAITFLEKNGAKNDIAILNNSSSNSSNSYPATTTRKRNPCDNFSFEVLDRGKRIHNYGIGYITSIYVRSNTGVERFIEYVEFDGGGKTLYQYNGKQFGGLHNAVKYSVGCN